MALNTLAIDIGKQSFHVFGIDDDGVIVSRKVSRSKLATTVERLDPKIVAMEACGSAHHWGRLFQAAGRAVRLINAYFVKLICARQRARRPGSRTCEQAADWPAAGGTAIGCEPAGAGPAAARTRTRTRARGRRIVISTRRAP